MFFIPPSDTPLTQGDIISDCPLVGLSSTETPIDLRNIPVKRWVARVIVLTQACDLAQGKSGRVLVAQVHDAQELVEAGVLKGPVVRDQKRIWNGGLFMSFTGHIQNGVVVFDQPVPLLEGTVVDVAVRDTPSSDERLPPTLWDRLKEVVGKAKGLPADASLRTDHYLTHGLPQE